jgi:hypothetical protein
VRFFVFSLASILAAALALSCSSSPFKYEKSEQLGKNDEFEKAVKIEKSEGEDGDAPATITLATPAAPVKGAVPAATPSPEELKIAAQLKKTEPAKAAKSEPKKSEKPSKKSKKSKKAEKAEEPAGPTRRQPELEDDTGFQGRRPLKDPFRVGEEVVHNMHYFKVSAGEMKMKVGPMATVNGRKAYNFSIGIKTSSVFSSFYSVDDKVETFVDYETLVPRVFTLHVKETAQLREARMLFDENTNKATFWEKKVSKDKGEEEKKQAWDILPFSQNVYSAVFYMRNFQWEVGKEVAFRVADDEQNLIFKAKCLRKEKLETDIGVMDAVVLKPEVMLKGVFKPMGDIFIWLSDDEHHYVLRIESKIKIGTIISEVVSIKPGHN